MLLRAPIAAALLTLPAAPGAAGPGREWDLRVELGGGVDDNPRRVAGPGPGQGFAHALVRAQGSASGDGHDLGASLTEAARLYPGTGEASAVATRVDADARLRLPGGRFSIAAAISARDLTEQAHQLDQHQLRGDGWLGWDGSALHASISAGWTLFAPRAAAFRRFEESGPEGWVRAAWTPSPGHLLSGGLGLGLTDFPHWGAGSRSAAESRQDTTFTASAEYAFRGPLLAALGYAWSSNASSAPGGELTRHRVTARAAAALPLELALALRTALQWSRYPRPLPVGDQAFLAEGSESQDLVEARLSRPLGSGFELVLAGSRVWSEAAPGVVAYSRTVAWLALGWRTGRD